MLDITKFLKLGRLDNIKVGMSVEECATLLGEMKEEDKHYYNSGDSSRSFSYFKGGVELIFSENELDVISINTSGTELILLSNYKINCYTSLERMLLYLELLGVRWEFHQKHTFNQQLILKTKRGVQISFKYDKGHGMMLSKIQRYLN